MIYIFLPFPSEQMECSRQQFNSIKAIMILAATITWNNWATLGLGSLPLIFFHKNMIDSSLHSTFYIFEFKINIWLQIFLPYHTFTSSVRVCIRWRRRNSGSHWRSTINIPLVVGFFLRIDFLKWSYQTFLSIDFMKMKM